MEEAERLCTRIGILEAGKLLQTSTRDQLLQQHSDCRHLEDVFLKLTGRSIRTYEQAAGHHTERSPGITARPRGLAHDFRHAGYSGNHDGTGSGRALPQFQEVKFQVLLSEDEDRDSLGTMLRNSLQQVKDFKSWNR